MKRFVFEIPGDPVPWARAGQSKNGRAKFTPDRQKAHMRRIAWEAKAAGVKPIEGAVVLEVTCIYRTPESWPKKKRLAAIGGFKTSKPDASNELKIIEDALNGIAYKDDAQVQPRVNSIYGWHPRTIVEVRPATDADLPRAAREERALPEKAA